MKDFLKHYTINLKTKSPVFIGDGKSLTKKEYIYDKTTIYIVDRVKLYSFLKKKNLENAFLDYMLKGDMFLNDFLKRLNITDFSSFALYTLNANGINRPMEIKTFIKDSFGMVYIPGSSLKGAIRTALLYNKIDVDRNKFRGVEGAIKASFREYNLKRALGRKADEIEKLAFDKEIKPNEFIKEMSGIKISDSSPIDTSNLALCQKLDVNKKRVGNGKINTLRECIKPEVDLSFGLTIDSSVTSITAEEIREAIEFFYDEYCRFYTEEFGMKKGDDNTLMLGGGVGFGSKTVMNSIFGDENDAISYTAKYLDSAFPKHKHLNDVKQNVSPRMIKCTDYLGKRYEFGKCQITIK